MAERVIHELKLNKRFFSAVASGRKNFEIRKDDRDYQVGDILILKEWDDIMNNFSGRSVKRQITYIYCGCGQYGLARDYVVMALKEVE